MKSGFVALLGRPNAGKSTLLNACLGKKAAITSPVAQTTRKRLRGIVTSDDSQIILVDTPGLHKPKDPLGKELNRQALSALGDVDCIAFLLDVSAPVGTGDAWIIAQLEKSSAYKLLLITKADLAKGEEQVKEQIAAAQKLGHFDDVLVCSSRERFNIDGFLELIRAHLPEGPLWFGKDMQTDAADEDFCAEFVREKVFRLLKDELPHATAVSCDSFELARDGHLSIFCTLIVERPSQVGILVGHHGSMIKTIGSRARKDLEALFGREVYLKLRVQFKRLWRKDQNEIRRLGYLEDDED